MRKMWFMSVAVLISAMVVFSACGDDEDGDNNNKAPALDCNTYGSDATKCDYAICALQGATGNSCYDDYLDCYMTGCPSGANVADADAAALANCGQEYSSCVAGTGTTDNGGSDNGSSDNTGDDPFAGMVDCSNTDATSCDYSICAYKSALDTAMSGLDCGTMQAYCDDYVSCYVDFVECFVAACPSGTSAANMDANAVTACSNTVTTCVGSLSPSK